MKIEIANKKIGNDEPCFIIAEAGVNHNAKLELARKLVDVAKDAGVDAVKFQTFKTEGVVTKDAPVAMHHEKKASQQEILKKFELSYGDFKKLKKYCDEKKIIFLSTPHSEDAIDFLEDLVPAYKIGSDDLINIPFLQKIAKKGKPIILSTGMGTLEEVKEAVDTIKKYKDKLILLHCTTSYPCERKDVNLKAMQTIQKECNVLVGYSDHTLGIDVAIAAVKLGAVIIEKHFTLNKNLPGPDHKSSLNPEELKEMVKNIRENKSIEISKEILGGGIKEPTADEIEMRKAIRKSIVANLDIKEGEEITKEMLVIKRPGIGIQPRDINKVIEKKASRDIKKDELIIFGMIK